MVDVFITLISYDSEILEISLRFILTKNWVAIGVED